SSAMTAPEVPHRIAGSPDRRTSGRVRDGHHRPRRALAGWYTPRVLEPPPREGDDDRSRKASRAPPETDEHLRPAPSPTLRRNDGGVYPEGPPGPGRCNRGLFISGRSVMPATVIVGLQWGDEGKGKATDFLAEPVA